MVRLINCQKTDGVPTDALTIVVPCEKKKVEIHCGSCRLYSLNILSPRCQVDCLHVSLSSSPSNLIKKYCSFLCSSVIQLAVMCEDLLDDVAFSATLPQFSLT